jgi:hypothetical protein
MSDPQLSSLHSSTHENTKHNWLVDRTKSKPVPPELRRLLGRPFGVTHRGLSMDPAHRWPLRSNKAKFSPLAVSGLFPSSP